MPNLLYETLEFLGRNKKTPEDVLWVGITDIRLNEKYCTWDDFSKVSDFEYYDGYGSVEISGEPKVVGDNWWLERNEYDGAEWWEFKTLPIKPDSYDALCFSILKGE